MFTTRSFITSALLVLVTSTNASAATTRPLQWPGGWTAPVTTQGLPVTTNFAAFSKGCTNADTSHNYTFYLDSGRKQHLGVDIKGTKGNDVLAIADGRVLSVGAPWGADWKEVVIVEHFDRSGTRFSVAYAHIATGKNPRTSKSWKVADMVKAGEKIGTLALTTGTHLHLGVMEGAADYLPGAFTHSGSGSCPSTLQDTRSPESFLKNRTPSKLEGSIVGYRNTNGSITSWLIVKSGSTLKRRWIASTTVYQCLRNRGAVDRGAMPSKFLDQLLDISGQHASCP